MRILSPKVVLFDMDGVLYDSMPNHAIAWQRAMQKFGIRMSALDAYQTEGMRGVDTIRIMVKEQQGRVISEAEAQEMYDEKTREFGLLPVAPI
ncbi:MAG: HAD family phosphatase, partial [Prevotella pleuritidis]|nr:HAD family phosphatase [Hoylesella pleuritidis]